MAILGTRPLDRPLEDRPLDAMAESPSREGSREGSRGVPSEREVVSASPKQGRKTTIAVMSSR